MARTFGIVEVTEEMSVLVPGLGGRTLSAGLAVWCLKLAGQHRALGLFLLCWVCAGVADTYVLLSHYEAVDQVWVHVFNTCTLAMTGIALLRL